MNGNLHPVLRHLRRVAVLGAAVDRSDADLLRGFVERRDEAAFEALVRRHGPMVHAVCRRVLHDPHDADDAFQAAFLVLVRRAGAVERRESLASWLHGVALRVSWKARAGRANRRKHERQAVPMPAVEDGSDAVWRDLRPVLDEEIQRLPEPYRGLVVLCYLEGKSYTEAASRFGCSRGTVSTRLTKARSLLRDRLRGRGVALSAGALGLALASQGARACPPALVASTLKAAAAFAAGSAAAGVIRAKVVALTKGALKAMLLSKLKVVAVVAALVVVALGGGLLYRAQATAEAAPPPPAALAAPGGKEDPSKDDETLRTTLLTLEKAWLASDGKPGTDTYGQFLADDFVCFTDDGEKSDKAQNLRAHMGYHVGADYKMSDVELIWLNEKAAILKYKIEYEDVSNATGKAVAKYNHLNFTTWVQRGGGWLMVFTHCQDLSPKPQNPLNPRTFMLGVSP